MLHGCHIPVNNFVIQPFVFLNPSDKHSQMLLQDTTGSKNSGYVRTYVPLHQLVKRMSDRHIQLFECATPSKGKEYGTLFASMFQAAAKAAAKHGAKNIFVTGRWNEKYMADMPLPTEVIGDALPHTNPIYDSKEYRKKLLNEYIQAEHPTIALARSLMPGILSTNELCNTMQSIANDGFTVTVTTTVGSAMRQSA